MAHAAAHLSLRLRCCGFAAAAFQGAVGHAYAVMMGASVHVALQPIVWYRLCSCHALSYHPMPHIVLLRHARHLLALTLSAAIQLLQLPLHCNAVPQGYAMTQGVVYHILSSPAANPRVRSAYAAYVNALNRSHSLPATLLKLLQCWLSYGLLWRLIRLLRVNVAVGWVWRCVLWPVILGQFWRPRWYITVGAVTGFRSSSCSRCSVTASDWDCGAIQCIGGLLAGVAAAR
jgi:hypothetical protein